MPKDLGSGYDYSAVHGASHDGGSIAASAHAMTVPGGKITPPTTGTRSTPSHVGTPLAGEKPAGGLVGDYSNYKQSLDASQPTTAAGVATKDKYEGRLGGQPISAADSRGGSDVGALGQSASTAALKTMNTNNYAPREKP